MQIKKLFVLANSIKNQQRCIAGRETINNSVGAECIGGWIRPVSSRCKGAISNAECRIQKNCIPEPLDVIEISCLNCMENKIQPENWLISNNTRWKKLYRLSLRKVCRMLENPVNLWLEPGERQDRITPEFINSRPNHQSLYLIKPESFSFSIEINPNNGKKGLATCSNIMELITIFQ